MNVLTAALHAEVDAIQAQLEEFRRPEYPLGALMEVTKFVKGLLDETLSDIGGGLIAVPSDAVLRFEQLQIAKILLSYLRNSSQTSAPLWIRPFLKLAKDKFGLTADLSQLGAVLAVYDDSGWATAPLSAVLSQYPNAPTHVRLFLFPATVETRPQSLAILGHEVGHVWCDENRQLLANAISAASSELDNQMQLWRGTVPQDSKLLTWLGDRAYLEQLAERQLIEFACDELGRAFCGAAFDLELIGYLVPRVKARAGTSHPAPRTRIDLSLKRLEAIAQDFDQGVEGVPSGQFSALVNSAKSLLANVPQPTMPATPDEISYQHGEPVAKAAFDKLLEVPKFKDALANAATAAADTTKLYPLLRKQLDDFVPPYEVIDAKNETSRPCPLIAAMNAAVLYEALHKTSGANVVLTTDVLKGPDATKRLTKYSAALAGHVRKTVEFAEIVDTSMARADWSKGGNKKTIARRYYRDISPMPSNAELDQNQPEGEPVRHPDNCVIVTPLLTAGQVSASAFDLRIGSDFLAPIPHQYTAIEPRSEKLLKHLKQDEKRQYPAQCHFRRIRLAFGETFVLHPHEFVLGSTLEYIRMPRASYGLVMGRSSWGRLGLVIATASVVQHGFRGALTLELRNLGEAPIKIPIGARVAQLTLVHGDLPGSYLDDGDPKYVGPVNPEVPKMEEDGDWSLLIDLLPATP